MTSPRIVFLDRETIAPTVELTRPAVAHDWQEHGRTPPEAVVARLAGAQVAISNKVRIGRDEMAALPELKFIAVAATGYDIIDIAAAREFGITVSNVRGYAVNTVPEHVMALILALRRGLVGYRQDVLAGEWQRAGQFCFFSHPIADLAGSTLALIGAGSIGGAVARLAGAFGMEVIRAERRGVSAIRPGHVPFEEALARADVISLHAPLTPETRGLIGAAEFAAMRRRPIVINTARGGVVDEAAAADAIEAGQIAGLGFDVLTSEPPQPDNPLLRVAHRPDVILTPHVAWASDQAMAGLWGQVIEGVEGFLAGAPVRVLT